MSDDAVFGRIERAVAEFNACLSVKTPAASLFIGDAEWSALCALCEKWGADFPPGGAAGYMPNVARAKFRGLSIYRVDSVSFLRVS
jgi:hypothetical protein